MLKDKPNTRKQGDVGVGAAIAWFTSKGYSVSIPLSDSQRYDLVVEIERSLKKIQVKTTCFERFGKYNVLIKTCGGNKSGSSTHLFDQNEVDYLFILTESGNKYLIPSSKVGGKHHIILGNKYSAYIVW